MTAPVIVVGAGASGLGAARALAALGPVVVVDRLPVPGGVEGWRAPAVRALADAVRAAGAELRLGATATRWDGARLLVCAPGAIVWEPASALVVATGWRPSTPAELGLVGARPAGVLPITVAHHLLETGAPLWRRPAIVGDALDAGAVVALLAAHGVRPCGVGSTAPWADPALATCRPVEVLGGARVEGLVVDGADGRRTLPCDAVLLAAAPRPARNIEGAVGPAPGVVFVQDDPALPFAAAVNAAQERLRAGVGQGGGIAA